MAERPIVAHIERAYLWPTETFIGNQVSTLTRYQPMVYCHHVLPNPNYDQSAVSSVEGLLPAASRLLDRLAYRSLRYLSPWGAQALSRQIVADGARLLHFHYLVDARFFLALKRLTGLPAVVSAYGYDVSFFPYSRAGQGLRYLRPVFEAMDCFIAMSQDMRQDMIALGCPAEKIVVHYHGIDTGRFTYPERAYADKPVVRILMCGTLEPKKAADRVLMALHGWAQRQAARQTVPQFEVVLMGEGPLRGRLDTLVAEYGWQDRVRFLGHVPYRSGQLVEEYRQADIFTLPSVTLKHDKEGIPGVIAEAMANGLPVVSTYHAGIPEIITDGVNGLLVQEDDLEGLGDALGRLILDAGLRERLGRAATRTAANWQLSARTPHLEEIYDRVLLDRVAVGAAVGTQATDAATAGALVE